VRDEGACPRIHMTEMVIAVFDAASAADAAVQDLEMAHIPTAVIRREIRSDSDLRDDSSASGRHNQRSRGRPSVMVVVDEMHAGAVTGILNRYGPLEIEDRPAQSHRR
jgi:hypothetical protein